MMMFAVNDGGNLFRNWIAETRSRARAYLLKEKINYREIVVANDSTQSVGLVTRYRANPILSKIKVMLSRLMSEDARRRSS
jgi:hypothetical protein